MHFTLNDKRNIPVNKLYLSLQSSTVNLKYLLWCNYWHFRSPKLKIWNTDGRDKGKFMLKSKRCIIINTKVTEVTSFASFVHECTWSNRQFTKFKAIKNVTAGHTGKHICFINLQPLKSKINLAISFCMKTAENLQ